MTKKRNKAKKSSNISRGNAMRTRDEFLLGGVKKEEYKSNPNQYYRVVYVVDKNANDDLAVVRRTTKKGRHLKSQPQYKFHEEVYIKDDKGKPIRLNKKFVRSTVDDITKADIDYILKRCKHYPDTSIKLKELKNNKKSPKK